MQIPSRQDIEDAARREIERKGWTSMGVTGFRPLPQISRESHMPLPPALWRVTFDVRKLVGEQIDSGVVVEVRKASRGIWAHIVNGR